MGATQVSVLKLDRHRRRPVLTLGEWMPKLEVKEPWSFLSPAQIITKGQG